jgi:hypothetical protein
MKRYSTSASAAVVALVLAFGTAVASAQGSAGAGSSAGAPIAPGSAPPDSSASPAIDDGMGNRAAHQHPVDKRSMSTGLKSADPLNTGSNAKPPSSDASTGPTEPDAPKTAPLVK